MALNGRNANTFCKISGKKEIGISVEFINLSGGIGIPYHPDQKPNDIYEIGKGVQEVYNQVLVPAGLGDVAIYTELGRFMLGPYGALVTQAIHQKHIYKEYIAYKSLDSI